MDKIKKIINNNIFKNLVIMGGIFLSFLLIDVCLRYFSNQTFRFMGWARSAPNLFTFSWIFIFLGVLYLIPKKKIRIITYSVLLVIWNLVVYSEYLHYKVLDNFYSFSSLFLAGEGKDYFGYAISRTDFKIILVMLISILIGFITVILIRKTEEIKKSKYTYIMMIVITLVLSFGCRGLAYYKLGPKADSTTWKAAYNPKNIYIDYNNQAKSLEASGIYELINRSAYLYIKDTFFSNKKEMREDVDNILNNRGLVLEDNKYTGVFKDKNVIYVLMESIDSWLVTEEVMPTLYKLQNEGLNFTNRYAPTFGGAQTINSEFAMNNGLYAISNGRAIYNYNNSYPYSLPNILNNNGYITTSIHTNTGNFYNRTNLHKFFGYNNSYFLDDMKNINHSDYNYYNDDDLIKNDETYKMIVKDDKFFTFLITYSAHVPYDNTNDRCTGNPHNLDVENNTEYSCIRNLARDTDEMLRLLIERLKEDNKLDDTVLVLVTDHYTYGYSDVEYIKNYKNVDNEYMIQHTPFIIWSNNIKHENVDILLDTADILPTLLNMMDIDYNPNYYVGTDIFSSYHDNFIYFGTDIFYDGKTLYNGNKVSSDDEEYVNNIFSKIKTYTTLNNEMVMSDYFRYND